MKLVEHNINVDWKIIWDIKIDGIYNPISNIKDTNLPDFISWNDLVNNLGIREDTTWKRSIVCDSEV